MCYRSGKHACAATHVEQQRAWHSDGIVTVKGSSQAMVHTSASQSRAVGRSRYRASRRHAAKVQGRLLRRGAAPRKAEGKLVPKGLSHRLIGPCLAAPAARLPCPLPHPPPTPLLCPQTSGLPGRRPAGRQQRGRQPTDRHSTAETSRGCCCPAAQHLCSRSVSCTDKPASQPTSASLHQHARPTGSKL